MTPTSEYELFLNHVYKLSERRQTVTTVYLSVNAALTSAIAFLYKDGRLIGSIPEISVLALLFSGIVACSLWRILITHYSKLIGWWYEQLRVLENSLQNSNRLITKEFHELYLIKQGKGPIGITRYTPRDRGHSFITASVVDPFGNILDIMYNPHFLEVLGSLKKA